MQKTDVRKLLDEIVNEQTDLIGGLLALRELGPGAAKPLMTNLQITRNNILRRLTLPSTSAKAARLKGAAR